MSIHLVFPLTAPWDSEFINVSFNLCNFPFTLSKNGLVLSYLKKNTGRKDHGTGAEDFGLSSGGMV